MVKTIQIKAIPLEQGDLKLYATAIPAKILISEEFAKTDPYDPSETEGDWVGYQREITERRLKEIADYLEDLLPKQEQSIPTSILLSSRDKKLDYEDGTLVLKPENMPLFIVDGQHRIKGLKFAIEERKLKLEEFPVVTVIAEGISSLHEMAHFYVINSTQKKIDPGIEKKILERMDKFAKFKGFPVPRWIQKILAKKGVVRKVVVTEKITRDADSPWFGKIRLPNEEKTKKQTIKASSFQNSLDALVSTSSPLAYLEPDQATNALKNYWWAILEILKLDVSDTAYSLWKTVGVEIWHKVAISVFFICKQESDFSKKHINSILENTRKHIQSDFHPVFSKVFWQVGGEAGKYSSGGARKPLIDAIIYAVGVKDEAPVF